MPNPVVVFVIPEELGKSSHEFPIGLTAGGELNAPAQENCAYCVLLLNDTADVPQHPPCHVVDALPLLIVPHNGSLLHPEPASENVWEKWATPYGCKGFSHLWEGGDPVFNDIRSFLADPRLAKDFAKRCHATNHIAAVDGLAALYQCALLDPDLRIQIDGLALDFERRLDQSFANRVAEYRLNRNWIDGLVEVRLEADRLVGGPCGDAT